MSLIRTADTLFENLMTRDRWVELGIVSSTGFEFAFVISCPNVHRIDLIHICGLWQNFVMTVKSICVQRGEFFEHFVVVHSADGNTTVDSKMA